MSKEQHKALRLADRLRDIASAFKTPSHERGVCNAAIETLRRKHARIEALTAQRDGLTEAMKKIADPANGHCWDAAEIARAAIANTTQEPQS